MAPPAGRAVGDYAYTRDRPVRPVVIHATHDKAHTLAGYFRYTADGTLISETHSVGIRTYKVGHWGSAGSARPGNASRSIEQQSVEKSKSAATHTKCVLVVSYTFVAVRFVFAALAYGSNPTGFTLLP